MGDEVERLAAATSTRMTQKGYYGSTSDKRLATLAEFKKRLAKRKLPKEIVEARYKYYEIAWRITHEGIDPPG